MLLAIWIAGVFATGLATMVARILPAILALPLMGIAIAGGAAVLSPDVGANDLFAGVIGAGSLRLHEAMVVALFGGMLSAQMQKSGTAESLVKGGAELFGDGPLAVSVLSMLLAALLFTSVGGLGAVILVALVVLPVLATTGVEPVVAGGVLLFGISLGGTLNAGNWVVYQSTLGLAPNEVASFALIVFLLTLAAGVAFVAIELARSGAERRPAHLAGWVLGTLSLAGLGAWLSVRGGAVAGPPAWKAPAQLVLGGSFALLVAWIAIDALRRAPRWRREVARVRPWAYLIPLVPLAGVVVFDLPVLPAFVIGIAYAWIATLRPGSLAMTVQSLVEGAQSSIPAVLLMIGIGVLVTAVIGPSGRDGTWPVLAAIEPYVAACVPKTPLGYVVGFGLLAPLSLYRGPLNVWGLGFGTAAILTTSGGLPPAAAMAVLFSVGQVQGICDPTNTANVWLANELRVDPQTLMLRLLPYAWALAFAGLAVGAALYMR